MTSQLSSIIKASRFPLICLVVLEHSPLSGFYPVNWNDFSAGNVYRFVTQCLSHNYAEIAVCCFFFFSGLLFFGNAETFSWQWCLKKWKNRVHTLLIPFISWNLLMVAAIALKSTLFGLFGYYDAEEMAIVSWNHILDWFRTPVDYPLWFMEDLMCMVLAAPLLYFAVRRFRGWLVALLLLVYASPLNPSHVAMRAIFFFSIGAWCGITRFDVLGFCRRFRLPCHILAVITLLLATFTNSSAVHEWTLRLFFPFGIMSFLNIIDTLISIRPSTAAKLQNLSASVFFIYAAHEIYILGWTKGFCLRLLGESLPAMYARYFLVPAIVVLVCYWLYRLLHRLTPRTLALLCGGR